MNSSAKLTQAELREAAAEAGISPEELRRALAERNSDLPARIESPPGVLASTSLESRLELPPEQASETVRRLLERRCGHRGHRQGSGRIDIVDDESGVVYQISGEADGVGGSLVKIEINSMSSVGSFALGSFIVGTFALGMIAFGYLVSITIMWLGIIAGMTGIAFLMRAGKKIENSRAHARALAAEALLEAEVAPPVPSPVALPPQGREL